MRRGTYRIGGDSAGGSAPWVVEPYDPTGSGRLGRGALQRLCWVDLRPDEGEDDRIRVLAGEAPAAAPAGPLSLSLSLLAARWELGGGGWESAIGLHQWCGGLTLVVAAVETADLVGSIFSEPARLRWYTPEADSARMWADGLWPSAPADLGVVGAWARLERDLWPEVSASGRASVDLRRLAGGARYLAVWVVGYWATNDAQAVPADWGGRAGWPVQWSIHRCPVWEAVPTWTAPVWRVRGAVAPTAGDLVASPDEYLIARVERRAGDAAGRLRVRWWNGGADPLWVWAAALIGSLPGALAGVAALAGGASVDLDVQGQTGVALYAARQDAAGVTYRAAALASCTWVST